ncbi:MAG: hypothetical protein AAF738_01010 [Bacteroidota bacterium]
MNFNDINEIEQAIATILQTEQELSNYSELLKVTETQKLIKSKFGNSISYNKVHKMLGDGEIQQTLSGHITKRSVIMYKLNQTNINKDLLHSLRHLCSIEYILAHYENELSMKEVRKFLNVSQPKAVSLTKEGHLERINGMFQKQSIIDFCNSSLHLMWQQKRVRYFQEQTTHQNTDTETNTSEERKRQKEQKLREMASDIRLLAEQLETEMNSTTSRRIS